MSGSSSLTSYNTGGSSGQALDRAGNQIGNVSLPWEVQGLPSHSGEPGWEFTTGVGVKGGRGFAPLRLWCFIRRTYQISKGKIIQGVVWVVHDANSLASVYQAMNHPPKKTETSYLPQSTTFHFHIGGKVNK
tara:strand:- start:126 stop:521 length:396 start_codon:yes stop_codon:yes gene_type:complete